MKIDIEDAIDRLQCMSREILPVDERFNKVLHDSQVKDKQLLLSLIPLVRSLSALETP